MTSALVLPWIACPCWSGVLSPVAKQEKDQQAFNQEKYDKRHNKDDSKQSINVFGVLG